MKQHSEENEKDDISEYQPKDWVFEILDLAKTAAAVESAEPPVSEAFMKRCAEAGKVALNFAKLREARQRVGFVPLPAADYIRQLIKQVGIPESSILSWLGRKDFSLAEPKGVTDFALVAQRVGISLREALVHLRIGFASQMGSTPVPILLARARSSHSHLKPIESSEAILQEIESGYDITNLRKLRTMELNLTASYDQTGVESL